MNTLLATVFVAGLLTAPIVSATPADSLERRAVDGVSCGKNPMLAGALSVFVPGLGHIYAGETVKGGVLTGLFVAGIGAVIASDIGQTHDAIKAGGWASVCFVGGVYLYALIDAPFAAGRENARGGESGAHLLRFTVYGAKAAIDPVLTSRGPGAILTLTL